MTIICQTDHLTIQHFTLDDAAFIVQLLNQPSFLRYIGDKKVRTLDDAIQYLTQGPIRSYKVHGFGLNLVIEKSTNTPIGMCGLIKREELSLPDIGYALLSNYSNKGYGFEAAKSVLEQGMKQHSLNAVQAITMLDNVPSNGLLKKLGFELINVIELYGSQNNLYQYEK
ncbi:GNAT family N-acetyltransferase [Vibrio rumoiensis]|uniref:GNAT family N-acetyltransferase n=1 Tax=Vibrio rumoiensis TaxID=76258 RepID=UPI000B5CD170|nr:GNAT family N-acetyltransferase [Vibrio rumoiensis]